MGVTSNQTIEVDRPTLKAYEEFISLTHPSEIARNNLLALVDATTKPILFGGKAMQRLTGTARYEFTQIR